MLHSTTLLRNYDNIFKITFLKVMAKVTELKYVAQCNFINLIIILNNILRVKVKVKEARN